MISIGDKVPSVPVKLINRGGTTDADSAVILSSGRVVMFTVPGAFTPTCHTNHLPGFLAVADKMKAKGIDRIICATANDHHVVKAWAQQSDALDEIEFIADPWAKLATAMGLESAKPDLGVRFIRSAIILTDGIVTHMSAETANSEVTGSGAPAIMAFLDSGGSGGQ